MPSTLVLSSQRYELFVKILAGEGDGPLIYLDPHGHIHHVVPDPIPWDQEHVQEALKAPLAELHNAIDEIAEEVAKLQGR